MADDPNRDILPVKEGSCVDAMSVIDLRERHLVCKLDRYQLEDKYLRLLDEANNLKKLCNCQEDKIKRLGTKLIRLAGNPRCGIALDIADDRSRTAALELENLKLKEKIVVMRNQLLSHTMSGRSSSRSRLVRPSCSGLVTCRSESNRARAPSCQCIVGAGDDDNDMRNYLVKIEKLEAQKKDMSCRITELEKELAYLTNNQKEKVAENVEYIRVWRQMKQLNDKLMTTQEKNTALTTEINDLKIILEQTTRNNQEIVAVLSSERTRIAEIDGKILKAKSSQFTLREKEEQIRDLTSEIKILQQHNNELIALTSKYGQVELENIELKKKLSDDAQEQQTLRIAFNKEQVNIVALKAANEQLLVKLQELQANIDTLTRQLTSLHTQDKKCNPTVTKPSYEEQCKKCCEMYDKIVQLEKMLASGVSSREDGQLVDKSIQTIFVTNKRDQDTVNISSNEDKELLQSPSKEWKTEINCTNVLSREKILKLLDQAQINTPLDASRIKSKEEYASILDMAQRHSDRELSSQYNAKSIKKNSEKRFAHLDNSNVTLNQMFLILFDILQEYLLCNDVVEKPSASHQISKDSLIDVNNNDFPTIIKRDIKQRDFCAETSKGLGRFPSTTVLSKNCACQKDSTIVLTRDIGLSTKRIFDGFLPEEKYKKSSYRDISKDICPEKIKLKRLQSPRYPKCNLTCHWHKLKDSLPMQDKQKLPCKIKRLDDTEKLPICSMESYPLLITDKQGLVEIHILRLQLSTSITKVPNEEDICSLHIYVSWDIWGEKTAYTPKKRCPNLIFNSSSVYRIADLISFFKNVLSECLIFRVNVIRPNGNTYILARAKVSIKDILDYPQNKLHYIVPVNGVICSSFGVNFGQLSLWVRLSCNVDMVEAFRKQCGLSSLKDTVYTSPLRKEEGDGPQTNSVLRRSVKPAVDIKLFKDEQQEDSRENQNPQLDSNVQNESGNSDEENYCDNEEPCSLMKNKIYNKSGTVMKEKSDFKEDSIEKKENNSLKDSSSMAEFGTLFANGISLSEDTSSMIRDMNEVLSDKNWERYKQKSLLTFAHIHRDKSLKMEERDRNNISTYGREKDAIIIEIISMQLSDKSHVMQDDEIHLLYVEYSFLGNHGEDMETVSMKKPKSSNEEIVYNYKKKFWINEVTHPIQKSNLRAMLDESISPNITFVVLSEPLPEEREIKECEEIGYATFNIKKYALSDESKFILLPIEDDQNRKIGTLKIAVSGLNAIRQCLSK